MTSLDTILPEGGNSRKGGPNQMNEIFWIKEVCDADQRSKLITKEAKDWFASKTIEEAPRSYEEAQRREEVTDHGPALD
jgi:hypothetical protein